MVSTAVPLLTRKANVISCVSSIRLVSSLVGLDEQVTVHGNEERIEKSSFSLTPAMTKSSAAHEKQSTISKTKRKLFDDHRKTVSAVKDVRLHKRKKTNKEHKDNDCVIVDSDAVECVPKPSKMTHQKPRSKKTVTPSPHPRNVERESNDLTPVRNTTSLPVSRNETASDAPRHRSNSSKYARNNQKGQGKSSSWFRDQTQVKKNQQTAFHSPKENPFASYTFDPNNVEDSLNLNSERSKYAVHEPSVIPNNVPTYSGRKPRKAFQTPANRRKGTVSSNRISGADLLQQKAAEFQQHHLSHRKMSRNFTSQGLVERSASKSLAVPSRSPALGISPVGSRGQQQYHRQQQQHYLPERSIPEASTIHNTNFRVDRDQPVGNYYQRPGTSAGSEVQYHSAHTMSVAPPGRTMHEHSLTPPFMGRRIARNSNYMSGPMAGVSRSLSSSRGPPANVPAGWRIADTGQQQEQQLGLHYQSAHAVPETQSIHTTNTNFQQPNFGASMPMHDQFSTSEMYDFQPQNNFQHQHDFHQQVQDFDSFHGSGGEVPIFQQGTAQQQFENTFNDPLCHGPVEDVVNKSHCFFENDNKELHEFNESLQSQPLCDSGTQPQRRAHNPYTQSQHQQHNVPSNPYTKKNQQQHDMPPMQEVVVQNHSGAQDGLDGDSESQLFEDAFL